MAGEGEWEGDGEVVDDGGVCGDVDVDVDVDVAVIAEGGVGTPTSMPSTPVPPAPAVVVTRGGGGGGGGGRGVLTKGGVLDLLAPKSDANPDVNLDAPDPTPALRSGDTLGLGLGLV